MKRREFITLIGGTAALWPLAAGAQQAMAVIGWLDSRTAVAAEEEIAASRRALKQAGFVEGENVAIQYRYAEGQYNRLPALAADLVFRKVSVLAAVGGPASGHAAKAATSTIPIVFTSGADPVKDGLVAMPLHVAVQLRSGWNQSRPRCSRPNAAAAAGAAAAGRQLPTPEPQPSPQQRNQKRKRRRQPQRSQSAAVCADPALARVSVRN